MKGKIFIIEDEASIIQLVQHNLEKEGFVVSSSLNGNEGLKELKKFEPNLLLLDWMLPDLSGIDICKNIRRDSNFCLLYTSPSPRDRTRSRMPSSA